MVGIASSPGPPRSPTAFSIMRDIKAARASAKIVSIKNANDTTHQPTEILVPSQVINVSVYGIAILSPLS